TFFNFLISLFSFIFVSAKVLDFNLFDTIDMAKPETGPLAQYNSLKDEHLAGYFNNRAKWRHLVKAGLITRTGEVVPEPVYRLKMARKEHKRHVRDMLAQAIVHKSLDLERKRQVDIRRKLEEIAKMEHVRRIKNERNRRGDEDLMPLLDPGAATSSGIRRRKQRPNRIGGDAEEGDGDEEPEPSGLPPHPDTVQRRRLRRQFPRAEIDSKHLLTLDSVALQEYANILESMRRNEARGGGGGSNLSSHRASSQPRRRSTGNSPSPGRRNRSRSGRPKSAARPGAAAARRDSDDDDVEDLSDEGEVEDEKRKKKRGGKSRVGRLRLHRAEPALDKQASYQSLCKVTLHYYGPALKIPHDGPGHDGQEVTVMQQHSGGNTLRVFYGLVKPGEDFTFVSRRHRGYPFSLSLYIDGVMDSRVSACCEYKHRTGVRLGSKTGHFGFVSVSEAAPCYRCQVEEQLKEGRGKKEKAKKESTSSGRRKPQKTYDDDFQDESDHDKRGKRSDKDSSSSSSSRSRGASVSSKSSRSSSIGRERVEYQVIIATFDEIGSGTEAPAFIELIGSSATSKKFPLKQYDGATTFERGATNEFTVKAREDLGELTAVRLHLEDGGIGSSWRPESITVSRGDQQWTFPAGRWIEKNECETFTVEDIAGENDDEVYVVTIQTSSQAMAGTDARVFATLVGEDRRSNRVQLKNDRIDCFERGQTDQFKARFGSNLGEIHSIELETEGGGLTSGWLPETITVANGGREWRFQTGRWIEKNSIETLPVVKDATGEDDSDAVDANERRFTVTVKTGDRMGADTDGRATIQLAGTEATSEQISLEEFRQNKDGRLYRRGQADKFNIQADEQLGDLKTIELYIEGGISTDWYVERVIAEQNDKRWEFPFERWIQKERPERCAAVAALPDRADDDLTRQRRASGSSRSDRSDDEEVVNFKIEGSPEHAAPDQQQKSAAAGVTEVPVDDAPDVEDSRNTQSTLVRKEEKRRRVSGSDRGSSGEDSDADRKKKGHIQTRISSFSEESDSGSEDERDQEPATLQIRPSSDEEDESEEEENQRWKEMEASRKREEEDRKREEEDRKREEEDRKREEEAAAAAQRREEERRQEEEERQRKQQQMLEDQLDRMRQEQQAIKEKGLCDYKIRFVTDSTEDAGTHATVSIVLCGEQGDSDVRTFKNEQGRKFQSGSTSEFSISIPDLGAINKIRIFTDVQYEQDRWLLSRVEVEDQQRGVTRSFPCGKWFTRDCDSHILLAPPTDDEVSQHEESRPSSARQAVPTLAAPPTAATTTTTGATTTSTGDAGSFGKPSTAASGTTATAQSSDTASTDESEQSDDDVSSTAEESSEADSDSSDSESDTETAGEDDEAAESVPRQNRMRSGSVQPDDIQPPETRIGKVRDLFKDNGVSVYDTKLSDEQFELFLKELNQREKAEKMESVSVRNCQLTDSQAIRMLEALAGYDKLNYLNLTCNSISSRTASVIAERLSGWPQLSNLNLHSVAIGDDGIYALVKGLRNRFRTNSSTIDTIDLGNTGMTDQGLQQVAGLLAENPPLAGLELTGSRGLSESAWANLGKSLRGNTKLESMMLDYCDLTDSSLAALLEGLGSNLSLISIDLEGNRLSDRACDLIANSAVRNGLRSVSLEMNGSISDRRKEALEVQLSEKN
ncbi:hypothetical protein BOX15_Mlig011659g1, partial [Macrostomum lignano]